MKFSLILILVLTFNLSAVFCQLKIPITRRPSTYVPSNIAKARGSDAPVLLNVNNAIDEVDGFKEFNSTLYNYQNLQYYGEVVAGTQNQTFTILFDSGSDSLWLPSSDCVGCAPTDNRFNCKESKTCIPTSDTDSIEYGSGSIVGDYVWEEVGLSAEGKINCSVLLVTEGKQLEHSTFDGILGLGSSPSALNFVDLAYEQKVIKDTVFSFYLDENPSYSGNYIDKDFMIHGSSNDDDSDGNYTISNSSYLLVGFIPENIVNNLFWLPVTVDDYWATDVIGLSVGDQPIDMTEDFRSRAALFDSGTSILALIPSVYNALVQDLFNYHCAQQGHQVMTCRCEEEDLDKYPNITFATRGISFNITARQYMVNSANDTGVLLCGVGIENLDTMSGIGLQIIGDNFLRSNYVAFSKRNQSMALELTDKKILRPITQDLSNFWTGIIGIVVFIIAILIINVLEVKAHKKEMMESLSDPNSPVKPSHLTPLKRSQTDNIF